MNKTSSSRLDPLSGMPPALRGFHRTAAARLAVVLVLCLLAMPAGASALGAPVAGGHPGPAGPEAFTSAGAIDFQGEVITLATGNPITDGSYNMRFAIYDAASGGNKQWPPSAAYEQHTTVPVSKGLFNVHLGDSLAIGTGVFGNGGDRYLQIWVCTTAGAGCSTYDDVGRLPISSVALAQTIRPGAWVTSTATTGNALSVIASATSGDAVAVYGSAAGPDGMGLLGYASGSDGYGVRGDAGGDNGIGVYGTAPLTGVKGLATHDFGYGVWGEGLSQLGTGVYGTATYTGVFGLATGDLGYGVWGEGQGLGAAGVGGRGPLIGVYGGATSTYTNTYSAGVYGYGGSSTGEVYGVYGITQSASGAGVYGTSNKSDGILGVTAANPGVFSYAAGVHGKAYNGTATGVFGESSSLSDGATGVIGMTSYPSTAQTYGVLGSTWTTGTNSSGVRGVAGYLSQGAVNGVWGETTSANSGSAGVFAHASLSTGAAVALWARSEGSGDIYRGYGAAYPDMEFKVTNNGNVYADGTYSSPAADFAELLPAAGASEPGDVLAIGPDGALVMSTQAYQLTVVGVYSTQPAFLGGRGDDTDDTGKVPLAVVGVVPVKASAENGAIQPGDLLVASSTPGHAMRAGANPPVGSVLGKALAALDKGTGVILMLVMLQ